MARGEDKPQGRHVIEHAKSDRSKCHTCGGVIIEDDLRLSEAFVSDEGKWARAHKSARTPKHREFSDDYGERHISAQNPDVWARFHHLACAAQSQPYKLASALKITSLQIPERAELERAIERAMSSVDVAEENAETRDEYLAFIERLRAGPDDDLALVFGDWLQSVEDPRGALVAVQHAIEAATGDERVRLLDEERKLLAEHRKYFLPERFEGTLVWRRGFVHRFVAKSVEQATTARVFEHPSLRLIREFAVETDSIVIAANLPVPLPATLRVIELKGSYIGVVAPVLANALPQLERLKLNGTADIAALRHPALAELELDCTDPTLASSATLRGDAVAQTDRITSLRRKDLPNVTRLILRATPKLDALVEALTHTELLKGIKSLALHGDLSLDGMKPLLRKKLKLDVIDVRQTPFTPLERDRLKAIAETVLVDEPPPPAAPPPPPEKPRAWLVKHTRRPEWGIGRVIEETEAGLQVEFEEGGAKLVRNVELLEEVDG